MPLAPRSRFHLRRSGGIGRRPSRTRPAYQASRLVPSVVAPADHRDRHQGSNQHVLDEVLTFIVPDQPENKRLHVHYSFSGFGHAREELIEQRRCQLERVARKLRIVAISRAVPQTMPRCACRPVVESSRDRQTIVRTTRGIATTIPPHGGAASRRGASQSRRARAGGTRRSGSTCRGGRPRHARDRRESTPHNDDRRDPSTAVRRYQPGAVPALRADILPR